MINAVRNVAVTAAIVVACLATTSANAALPNKCASGKEKCAAQKASALLTCHAKEELKGVSDPTCVSKAKAKFDGGGIPSKSCFGKLEARLSCFTTNDTGSMEAKVDAFVLDVVQELDPGYPTPVVNRCSAAKKKCVLKKQYGILGCYAKAALKGFALDPNCIAKVQAKFDGGAVPANGCFARTEAKYGGAGCLTTGDTAALENKVDAFAADVASELEPLCGNNTIESPFETCDGTQDAACPGLCRPPGADFECTCPFCGDRQVNQASEVCDRTDDSACPAHCTTTCTCAVCGNNVTEPFVEQCDGTDDASCPGQCAAPATINECQCPVCGDNVVNQASEQCDGSDDSACVGRCTFGCTCAVCGNNVAEAPAEACDGTDDSACPGLCAGNCTCP